MKEQLLYGYSETCGEGLVAILCSLVREQNAQQVFLVRGKHSYVSCGAQEKMNELRSQTGVNFIEFSEFSANPKDEEALKGLHLLLGVKPDLMLAIGGGSVLDTAKLIRHYAADLWAVPTTSGTGAEATHFAVVYRDGKKCSVEADDILPDIVMLYPPFTYNNNAYLTACTGFDAVAQAIESYWAKGANEESRTYSVKALGLLWKQLPSLVHNPTEELRNQVAEGAYWAGRAINISKTTAPHAFSYAFTSHYGYPHGHAVSLTFPFFLQLNGSEELFSQLGFSSVNIVESMEHYISSLGLSLDIPSHVDISGSLRQVNTDRLSNNPIIVNREIVSELNKYLNKL